MEANSGDDGRREAENPKKIKWSKSEAKFLLREDIIGGVVGKDMKPINVYSMRPCYKDFKYENFRSNLRAMRLSVQKDLGRAEDDEKAYFHDKNISGRTADGLWHRSEAQKKLKEDMDAGNCEGTKPQTLYRSRLEYQEFPLDKFRREIYHARVKEEKRKMIMEGTHPRFMRLMHDPHKQKVKSSDIFPSK